MGISTRREQMLVAFFCGHASSEGERVCLISFPKFVGGYLLIGIVTASHHAEVIHTYFRSILFSALHVRSCEFQHCLHDLARSG